MAVVAIGVTFAALQVRQEALARRLQGISALFDVVWPEEASRCDVGIVLGTVEGEVLAAAGIDLGGPGICCKPVLNPEAEPVAN